MLFGTAKRLSKFNKKLTLYYNGDGIHNAETCKYLGTIVDSNLSLSTNCDKMYKRTTSKLHMLYSLWKWRRLKKSIHTEFLNGVEFTKKVALFFFFFSLTALISKREHYFWCSKFTWSYLDKTYLHIVIMVMWILKGNFLKTDTCRWPETTPQRTPNLLI